MRVDGTKQAGLNGTLLGDLFAKPAGKVAASASESRALVVSVAPPLTEGAATHRQAAFLAHLIATKEKAPQTRARRRAEPSEAIAAYRAVAAIMQA